LRTGQFRVVVGFQIQAPREPVVDIVCHQFRKLPGDEILVGHHRDAQPATRHERDMGARAGEVAEMMDQASSTMVFFKRPTPVISTSTTSPAFIHTGGSRLAPTPPGVPVRIRSPGDSGVKADR